MCPEFYNSVTLRIWSIGQLLIFTYLGWKTWWNLSLFWSIDYFQFEHPSLSRTHGRWFHRGTLGVVSNLGSPPLNDAVPSTHMTRAICHLLRFTYLGWKPEMYNYWVYSFGELDLEDPIFFLIHCNRLPPIWRPIFVTDAWPLIPLWDPRRCLQSRKSSTQRTWLVHSHAYSSELYTLKHWFFYDHRSEPTSSLVST